MRSPVEVKFLVVVLFRVRVLVRDRPSNQSWEPENRHERTFRLLSTLHVYWSNTLATFRPIVSFSHVTYCGTLPFWRRRL